MRESSRLNPLLGNNAICFSRKLKFARRRLYRLGVGNGGNFLKATIARLPSRDLRLSRISCIVANDLKLFTEAAELVFAAGTVKVTVANSIFVDSAPTRAACFVACIGTVDVDVTP